VFKNIARYILGTPKPIHNAPPERFIRSIGQWQERFCKFCAFRGPNVHEYVAVLYFWIFHGFFRILLCVLIGSFARCSLRCTFA